MPSVGLWLEVGKSQPRLFFYATVDVIRASRIALYLSAALLAAGTALAVYGRYDLHPHLMALGLLSFYYSVMYIQLPGFINAAPAKPVTWALLALFVAAVAATPYVGYAAFAGFSALYAVLYLKGVWGRAAYYPNWVAVAGLLALPLASSHIEAMYSFPLASVYALMYRIDSSRAKRRFTAAKAGALAVGYAVAFAAAKAGYLWSPIIPSLILTAAAPPVLKDVYSAVSLLFRFALPLAFLHHHAAYMSFAIIMSALCIPYFVPSVLYRYLPSYGPAPLVLSLMAFVFRLFGQIAAAGAAVIALIAYVAYRSLSTEPIPLKPP
ncbi:hypothetical protein Pogu_1819 [Pyrobaculum oguniense TE7]|uniref:Uncharacterized protein n=1 Tax=Pyrobaculum oguniense (strain DSM 13380 / JCM 10595 / TE7) TaxID=698757 RepID=H6Q9H8_PYROT|nr:hypothetical protein Pogu_1819 [Pyrobaculum oguniense TE7]